MSESPQQRAPVDGIRLSYGYRFHPQVLVLVVALLLASPGIVGAIVSAIHVVWSSSFRTVDYTMEEARPNDGAPYISGRRADNGEVVLVAARRSGDGYLVGPVGDETFAAGKTIALWVSDAAPDIVIAGQRTNAIPVASLPERPGWLALLGNLAWIAVVAIVAIRLAKWMFARRAERATR